MADINLFPLNDLAFTVKLYDVDTSTAKVIPLTTGTVTTFLSLTPLPTAVAADDALLGVVSHAGNGVWLVRYDAVVLDPVLLDPLFGASGVAYAIVQQDGGIRGYVPLVYSPSRLMTVA